MKRIISLSGLGSVALTLLLTSCVSKRKYLEAQNNLQQCRTETTEWSARESTMKQNISTLEEKNQALQRDYDNTKTMASNQQKRWENFRTYYDQQKSTSEEIHQQLHSALDNTSLSEKNIFVSNRRVYVNLPENILFTSGTSKLSTKGKDLLQKVSGVLKDKQDVEIEIVDNSSNLAGSGMNSDWDNKSSSSKMDNTTTNPTVAVDVTTDQEQDPAKMKKNKQAGTKTKKPVRNQSGETGTYEFGTTKRSNLSKTENWNLQVARATSIARELNQNGMYNVYINTSTGSQPSGQMNNQNSDMSAANATPMSNQKGFQLVINPKTENFYKYMDEGQNTGTK